MEKLVHMHGGDIDAIEKNMVYQKKKLLISAAI